MSTPSPNSSPVPSSNLRTCSDCMHWQEPPYTTDSPKSGKAIRYGSCSMLVVHPRTKQVVPEQDVERSELWRTEPFHTAHDFNACKGWAPADRSKAKPQLQLIEGGRAS